MEAALEIVKSGHNLLVTGQAGTGKSYFLKMAAHALKKLGKRIAVLCPTGVAATHLSEFEARTLHRYIH